MLSIDFKSYFFRFVLSLMVIHFTILVYGQNYNHLLVDSSLSRASELISYQPELANEIIDEQLVLIKNQVHKNLNSSKVDEVLFHQYIRAYIIKGIIYKNNQKYYESYITYKEALLSAELLGNDRLQMILHNNIAVVYSEIGDIDLRDKHFAKAFQFSRKLDDYELERGLAYNQALFYLDQGETHQGLQVFEPIYERAIKENDSLSIAAYWTLRAQTQLDSSQLDNAISSYLKALDFSRNYPDDYFSITSRIDLAALYLKQGKLEQADLLINENVSLMSEAEEYGLYLETIKLQAEIYKELGRHKISNDLYTKYKTISDSLGVEESKQATLKKGFLDDFNEKQQQDSIHFDEQQKSLLSENTKKIKLTNLLWVMISLSILIVLIAIWLKYRKNKLINVRRIRLLNREVQILRDNHLKLEERLKKMSSERKSSEKSNKKYKYSSLTKDESERILDQLIYFMKNEKPFLDPAYSLKDLSVATDVPSHHISEVLNNSLGQNFYTFFNIFRVEEAKKMMMTNTDGSTKLLAICYDSGFNSKATFNRVFKLISDKTPSAFQSEYLKK